MILINFKFMSKINKIFLILFGVLIVLLIAILAAALIIYGARGGDSYYAVYLSTGDIYFGKTSFFSKNYFSDVWFLQKNLQDEQNPYSLAKLKDAFWGPQDSIYLNPKNIIWKVKLGPKSQVLDYIKNNGK